MDVPLTNSYMYRLIIFGQMFNSHLADFIEEKYTLWLESPLRKDMDVPLT